MLTAPLARAIAQSIRARIEICNLDLSEMAIATEAATGPYAVTAVAAALAGAQVFALAHDTNHGTAFESKADVATLLEASGAPPNRIAFASDKNMIPWEAIDIVTNSGVIRPIDRPVIERLPSNAAIALMYEAWEARHGDIDYVAARENSIPVVGVDEHHPACGAFQFVGDLAVAAAYSRGWPLREQSVGVISDNPFAKPVAKALRSVSARVSVVDPSISKESIATSGWDLAFVATTPARSSLAVRANTSATSLARLVVESGAYGCIQLWGDLDRDRLRRGSVLLEPRDEPDPGHQGISMAKAGFEAVVRLQVGGLAAVLHRDARIGSRLFGLSQRLSFDAIPELL